MPIIRSYECMDCKELFEVTHQSGEEPLADCPFCEKVLEWRPKPFAITGVKSKAVDVAQDILETDYGLTNFKDGSREGDTVAIMPAETTQQREARMRIESEVQELAAQVKGAPENPAQAAAVSAFWGGPAGQAATPNTMMAQTLIASAKAGPQANTDAMAGLHRMGREGKLPSNVRIIARG